MTRINDLLPIPSEPNRTRFGNPMSAIFKPLGTRAFQTHSANLFAATFNIVATNEIALLTKIIIVHSGQIVSGISSYFNGWFCSACSAGIVVNTIKKWWPPVAVANVFDELCGGQLPVVDTAAICSAYDAADAGLCAVEMAVGSR